MGVGGFPNFFGSNESLKNLANSSFSRIKNRGLAKPYILANPYTDELLRSQISTFANWLGKISKKEVTSKISRFDIDQIKNGSLLKMNNFGEWATPK